MERRDPSRSSLSNRDWVDPRLPYGEQAIRQFARRLNISEVLGRIMAVRDLMDVERARRFLNPGPEQMHSPFAMLGMREGVARIVEALHSFHKILVIGDYDVDGTASTSMLYSYLRRLGGRVHYFIPHRTLDGYSLSASTVQRIREWNVDLVITTDHGSTAMAGAQALEEANIDLIVTDHHQMGPQAPRAAAIVNPHQPGCPYPFNGLSAAGVVFKLIVALDEVLAEQDYFDRFGLCRTSPAYYLDLVAFATVADMAPLVDENRTLVKLGLEMINTRPRPGLSGLIKESNVRASVSPSTITFKLAPKINALGRVGDPALGVKLLLTHSFTEARRLARHLSQVNRERQRIEREVYARAMMQVEQQAGQPAYVLVGGDWHPGVLGSIATRIAYQSGKPTVVLTLHETPEALGSARSLGDDSVLDAVAACEPLLARYGGHPNAVGLAVPPDHLEAFTRQFLRAVRDHMDGAEAGAHSHLQIEAWVDPEMLHLAFVEEMTRLSPFGHANPEPVLAVRGLVLEHPALFNNRHLRFEVPCAGGVIEAFAWDHPEWSVCARSRYDMAFRTQLYDGPSGPKPQLQVVDLKQSE